MESSSITDCIARNVNDPAGGGGGAFIDTQAMFIFLDSTIADCYSLGGLLGGAYLANAAVTTVTSSRCARMRKYS